MSRFVWLLFLFIAVCTFGASPNYTEARDAHQHTDYDRAITLLTALPARDAAAWALLGMSYFGKAEYTSATDAFEQAIALDAQNSVFVHWLGKAWGRRAESGSPLAAPLYANRARVQFEKAVALDASNKEALNDLFDYYLEAPGFLGGGFNRALALVPKIAQLDEAEGHYARAQLADKHKQFAEAEQELRRAIQLSPVQVGRVIDLAKYLSKLGRIDESDRAFSQAEKMAPGNPRLLFERAETFIRDNRNVEQARVLLRKYIASNLTPDDPPRQKAEALLRKAGA